MGLWSTARRISLGEHETLAEQNEHWEAIQAHTWYVDAGEKLAKNRLKSAGAAILCARAFFVDKPCAAKDGA